METEKDSVIDGKISLTDEQIGKLQRKLNETIRQIKSGTIDYEETIGVMQNIIIEGKAPIHLSVIKGTHEIKPIEHIINLDADPFIPPGWTVVEHKKGGLWKWNSRITLHLSRKQKKGLITGHDLRKELADLPVLNANVLDYLWEHPELIPENWKGKAVFFWGTIYRDSDGYLFVRYLYWNGSRWRRYYSWLDGGFSAFSPAALAS